MNRILQADVILTLTTEQAERLIDSVSSDPFFDVEILRVILEQGRKQGVAA